MSDFTRRQLIKSGMVFSVPSLLALPSIEAEPVPVREPALLSAPAVGGSGRERLLMDANWKFALGNADDPGKDFGYGSPSRERTFAKPGSIGQSGPKFNDSGWKAVSLPHDWAVELPFISKSPAPEQGARPLGRDYPATSVGWYRKSFSVPAGDSGKRIQIQFDGVYRDAAVFLNGHYLAANFSGYAPFTLDVTDYIEYGGANALAVRVDASLGDGWFYEGAGIYRHVWMIKSGPVHLVEWGTYVRSEVSSSQATIGVGSEVRNATDRPQRVNVVWTLLDHAGATVGTAKSTEAEVPAGATHLFEGQTAIAGPSLWSIETPTLYRAIASVQITGAEVDSDATTFGIRSIHFDAEKGFFLNGKRVKIKGTCCHQDHAGVGAALPDRIQYYRIERLKSMGSNGLRTSHNPPAPELMDATDALGMVVMCETRMMDSSPEGLSQLERMVRRFRNHPSIVIWSLGNEEPEQGSERGKRIVSTMKQLTHRLDPTRLCTVAMNDHVGSGISGVVDVQGVNYQEGKIDKFHRDFPKQPCIGTETGSTLSTRGIYGNDKEHGYMSAYDRNAPGWGSTAQGWWSFYDEREFLAGGFAWTGFDYRGEPTPYSWPCVSSHFGIMDVCGFPKDNYYYYKAWWGTEPVLHLFPHWNWPAEMQGKEVNVWCHANVDSVELFVNGTSVGKQKVTRNKHIEWTVKYQPGVIEVRGSRNGKELTSKRETVGEPAKIVLSADRSGIDANREDVSMIWVEVQDAQGRYMPIASNEIVFEVMGPGKLIGVGNGDPSSHEPDHADRRRVFNGWAQAIVQAQKTAGVITLQASSAGLQGASIEIQSGRVNLRPAVA